MCGAGTLPARMAAEAQRQGWRVVAFAFGDAPSLRTSAERVIPSRLAEFAAVLQTLREEHVEAVLLTGKFWVQDVLQDVLGGGPADATSVGMAERAGALTDARMLDVLVKTLEEMEIALLDQRQFLVDGLATAGCWSARRPTEAERRDVERGLRLARQAAAAGIGQTVVLRRGAVAAVEALEGTTEVIRRGAALAGPGAVIVKAVAGDHDYRFDTPAIGPESLEVAAVGKASVLAVEAGRVLIVDKEASVRRADAAGIAFVGV
jgi:DUF1009 family protein